MATQQLTIEMSTAGDRAVDDHLQKVVAGIDRITAAVEKSNDSVNKQKDSFRQAFSEITNIVKNISAVAASAIGAVYSALEKQVALAAQFTDDMSQLGTALSQLPTKKTAEDFLQLTDKLALATGQSQDFLIRLTKMSVLLTGSADSAGDMTRAAVALSKTLGVDARSAVRGLAQTLSGSVGELAQDVPALRGLSAAALKAGKGIQLVLDQFGPALEARLGTTTGQWERLINIVGDRWYEVAGLAITENKALAKGLESLGDSLVDLAPSVEELIPILQDVILFSAKTVSALMTGMAIFAQFAGGLAKGLGTSITDMIRVVFLPLQGMVDGIVSVAEKLGIDSPLIEFAGELSDSFDELARAPQSAGEAVDGALDMIADGLSAASFAMDKAIGAVENYTKKAAGAQKKSAAVLAKDKAYKKWVDQQVAAFEKALHAREKHAQDAVKIQEKMAADLAKENAALRNAALTAQAETLAALEEQRREHVRGLLSVLPGGDLIGTLVTGTREERQQALADTAATALQGLAGTLDKGFRIVKDAFTRFLNAIADPAAFEERVSEIGAFLESITSEENIARFSAAFFSAIEQVLLFLQDADKIAILVDNFIAIVVGAFERIVQNLGPILEVIVPAILQIVQALFEMLANSDFLMVLVDAVVKLVLGILQMIIENLPQIFTNLVRAVLDGIGSFIEGIVEMLAKPDFITKFVLGVVNLIFAIIEGIAKLIDRIVVTILKNLIPIVLEVFKAVVKAIAQVFLRGIWAVLRTIVKAATFGIVDIGDAPGSKGVEKTIDETGSKEIPTFLRRAHSGARLRPGEETVVQTSEAIVVPNSPRQFAGLSTGANGRVQGLGGGVVVNLTINAIDGQSTADWWRREGQKAFIDALERRVTDSEGRTLAGSLAS